MKFSLITTTLALASAAVAAPGWGNNNNQPWNQWQNQLSQSAAENIVNKFISVLTHTDNVKANATAQALLANDFSEVSDSILSLEGQPLGGNSFPSKQEYINGLLGSAPVTGVNTLGIFVPQQPNNKIVWQWKFTGVGTGQYPVKGFNLFTLNAQQQIQKIEVEFNSVAWGQDTGYTLVFPANISATG